MQCNCKNVDPIVLRGAEELIRRLAAPGSPESKEMLSRLAELATGCGYEKDTKGDYVQFPKQEEVLEKIGPFEIIKEHDDGDLTVRRGGKLYVITTEGQTFEQVGL